MDTRQELARAVVENYGQPTFATCVIEFNGVVGSEQVQLHMLREAGLKQAMLKHARGLRHQGEHHAARNVIREVGRKFGNSTKK